MRAGSSRILSWVAIYAVALHAILLGLAPPLSAGNPGPFDPSSVICHSVAGDESSSPQSDRSGLIPGHACEHCNLCAACASPAAPHDLLAGILTPGRILDVLRPVSVAARPLATVSLALARGPPLPA